MKVLSRRESISLIAGAGVVGAKKAAAARATPPAFYSRSGQYMTLRPTPSAPSRPIVTTSGTRVDFAALRGDVVLVNFWATWCVPCIDEMPSLDRLQAASAGKRVSVLPIAMDTAGKRAVVSFYQRLGMTHLGVYTDPEQQIGYFRADNPGHAPFPLFALPITYAIDPKGIVRGYVPGAATWDSPQAAALIDSLQQ